MPSKALKLSKKNLSELTRVAVRASQSAGRISKDYFYKNVKTQRKTDDSPVTIADRHSELEIRRVIKKHFPSHEIFGEEFGREKNRDSEFEWIIDPIDGTLQFIRGLPFWGSVLGLCYQGRPIVGVIHHPILSLSIWGSQGGGAFANGKKVRCKRTSHLNRSLILYSGLRRNSKIQRKFLMNVLDAADDDRGIGDCYGHSLVIQGVADAMIDLKVSAHDICGVQVCVEEAGGSFFGLNGKKSIHESTALSCSKALAPKILKYFN